MIVDHEACGTARTHGAPAAAPGCDRARGGPAAARCPVCACPVETAGPRCLRCRAPHHGDCWRYNGGCGIYACQGAMRQGNGLARAERGEAASLRGALGFVTTLLILGALRALLAGAPLP